MGVILTTYKSWHDPPRKRQGRLVVLRGATIDGWNPAPLRMQLIRFPAGTQDYLKCAEILLAFLANNRWVCFLHPTRKTLIDDMLRHHIPGHGAFFGEPTCFKRPFQTSKMSSTVSVSGISATRSHLELLSCCGCFSPIDGYKPLVRLKQGCPQTMPKHSNGA